LINSAITCTTSNTRKSFCNAKSNGLFAQLAASFPALTRPHTASAGRQIAAVEKQICASKGGR
jgi:hypothetical protein